MQKRFTTLSLAVLLCMGLSYAETIGFLPKFSAENPISTDFSHSIVDTGDVEPPVITCLNGLSVNIMPTGMITLWATDFIASATDNVTPLNQIKWGIRKAGTGSGFPVDAVGNPISSITFDCGDLGIQTVETWAIDLEGNAGYCTVGVEILDGLGHCSAVGLDGKLCFKEYCTGFGMTEVDLRFYADSTLSNPPAIFFQTGFNSACIDLPQFFPIDSTYTLAFDKDDNPLNGVTGFDVQLLSKHLQGTQPFTEPWQFVAADANQDNVVDFQDSITLVHLILGFDPFLPNEASWRFFPSYYVFPSPNPLSQPIPETIRVSALADSANFTFYGIKIGDLTVNCLPQTPVSTPANPDNFYAAVNPNPTAGEAVINVYAEKAASARLQIRDVSGKLSHEAFVQLAAGKQNLELPDTAIPAPGVYFWSMQVGGKLISGKLVRI